jgi:agmatine deiminase
MHSLKNYYMPAEWAEHERTFIEWPVKPSLIWPDNYAQVCSGYAETARAIASFETVTMIVNENTAAEAKGLCGEAIEYLTIPHNDAWCRDNGPTFVLNKAGQLAAVNWQFNAWGEKFARFELDNQVAPSLLEFYQISYYNASLILEGGSIHVDGEGTLMTTRECLLNKNRNPHLSKDQIEDELRSCLGIANFIWLERGLFGDETDGHVDNAACFAQPGVVLIQVCYDSNDPNYALTHENLEILKASRDASGRILEIIEVPQPPARYYQNERLTLSYLNFYFVNGGIILPVFGGDAEQTDKRASEILHNVFPARQILSVDGMNLINEGGNVHCITQQMPKSRRS